MLSEIWDRVAPGYREPFQRKLTEALREGGPFEFDFMLLDGDESARRWLRMRGHPEFDRHGVRRACTA
ncbi:hypothetical protein [Candidatus Burkholderia verschuerenii]|uniref:hypothetical protein n=1 Tax=Candidatus Burkholderia verschuerenii TaxID=242163 RepID=UPI000B202C86|nr:hypothetical protein [Candidatus Burkholderia verschuerenii]